MFQREIRPDQPEIEIADHAGLELDACLIQSWLKMMPAIRLDYLSCILTVVSAFLIGKKLWHGWIIAGINSAVVCVIGMRTAQFGFVPANLFCIVLYSRNYFTWRQQSQKSPVHPTED